MAVERGLRSSKMDVSKVIRREIERIKRRREKEVREREREGERNNIVNCLFIFLQQSGTQSLDMSSDLTVGVGTPMYCSPEEMRNRHYTEKVCRMR